MLLWASRLALLAAAVSAVALARFRADHRPFAAFLAWIALSDALRAVLAMRFGLIRPLGSPPFTGFARIAFHIDEAIGLSGPAALAITTILLFVRRRYLQSSLVSSGSAELRMSRCTIPRSAVRRFVASTLQPS
jgi:uncharacterized membrane protein